MKDVERRLIGYQYQAHVKNEDAQDIGVTEPMGETIDIRLVVTCLFFKTDDMESYGKSNHDVNYRVIHRNDHTSQHH